MPDPDTRDRAVRLVLDGDRTVASVAGELGLGASTVGRWVRAARRRREEDWWAGQVAPHFGFLGEFGFALTGVHAAHWWEVRAVYRADPVAVLVVYSVEFVRVEVRLIRAALLDLDQGRTFVTGVPGLHGHVADPLAGSAELVRSYAGLAPDRVEAALAFWAGVVREHVADLGSLLDAWEDGSVTEVTVFVPRSATAGQEARAVARTRAALPHLDVTVKRYPVPE